MLYYYLSPKAYESVQSACYPPSTRVPLIVYFNESDGLVTFEKDEEAIGYIKQLNQEPG